MIRRTLPLACPLTIVALALSGGGCATLPAGIGPPTKSELASATVAPDARIETIEMLAMTPAMREFVDGIVATHGTEKRRLSRLFRALSGPGLTKIDYDVDANFPAAKAFSQRRANCLSFASLFIALARESGFNASFQEVDVPPSWTRTDNNILVRYLHVNTAVKLPGGRHYVAEFREERFDTSMPRRVVSDQYALGLHYNNIGAMHLFDDELTLAKAYFIQAVETDPELAIGWINLGVVHRLEQRTDLAEISYRQALATNSRADLAMTNLAKIYADEGRTEVASKLNKLARHERRKNPHYHYALAQKAFSRADYYAAKAHLKSALRRDQTEHRFHHLMALTMRALGDQKRARQSLVLAEKNASKARDKQQYRATLAAWAEAEKS